MKSATCGRTSQGTVAPTANEFTGQPYEPTGMSTSYLRAGYADTTGLQTTIGLNYYGHTVPLSGGYFQGSLDEVASYNTALTASQVQATFAAGVAQATPAAVRPPPPHLQLRR